MDADPRPLWGCPACRRTFAQRNQTHSCAALRPIGERFVGVEPQVREAFDAVLAVVVALGPVEVLVERTRIALHRRMSFAAFVPRRRWLDGHVVLARRVPSERWPKVEVYSPRNIVHGFRRDAAKAAPLGRLASQVLPCSTA